MIAKRENDRCYSIDNGWRPSWLNTDGRKRETLGIDEARSTLDFEIFKKPNYDGGGRTIPKQFHLVRSDDNAIIESSSVGARFVPIQHRDVFDYIVNDIMPAVPEMRLEICGTLHGGGTGLIAATYGDTYGIRGDRSPNNLRLFFANPCTGNGRMVLGFTTVRIVCENTLVAATREARADGWRISHTECAGRRVEAAVEAIRTNAVKAIEMKRMCADLASVGVGGAILEECLEAVYPISGLPDGPGRTRLANLREEVVRQFESGETAQTMAEKTMWTAFNAFTYPIFHPSRIASRNDNAQIAYKGMTGDIGEKVHGIFQKVYAVAKSVA